MSSGGAARPSPSGLTIFATISMLGGRFAGAAADKFGTRRLVIAGMVLSGCTFAPLIANRLITAFGWREGYIWLGGQAT